MTIAAAYRGLFTRWICDRTRFRQLMRSRYAKAPLASSKSNAATLILIKLRRAIEYLVTSRYWASLSVRRTARRLSKENYASKENATFPRQNTSFEDMFLAIIEDTHSSHRCWSCPMNAET